MQFHERLKEYRREKGITQEELAEKIHVSRSAVAKWENGLSLPGDDSLDEIAKFFGVTREDLLNDRETETIIVEKNGKLSRHKKWLIALIAIATALVILAAVLLSVFLTRESEEVKDGSGEVVITGISASFDDADYEYLDGNERLKVYRLKSGETYAFYVKMTWRGSQYVALGKSGVEIYYDTQLFTFDEGEYWEEPDRDATPTYDYPFYFTCLETAAYTEIFVTASGYWCSVAVIIEN